MSFFQILIPVTLVLIGIADITYRKQLAGIIVAGLGGPDDPQWAATLETVQLISGGGFVVVGLGLGLLFWMGFNPFV